MKLLLGITILALVLASPFIPRSTVASVAQDLNDRSPVQTDSFKTFKLKIEQGHNWFMEDVR